MRSSQANWKNHQVCHCCNQPMDHTPTVQKLPRIPVRHSPQLIKTGSYQRYPSPKFIEGARVGSCNKVILKKGKQSTAIPFYQHKSQKKAVPSSFFTSWSHDIHTLHVNEHAGISQKQLIPYHPEAMRNRLQPVESPNLRKNNSQFQIGDLSKPFGKHFMTTYKTYYTRKDNADQVSHLGILCNRTIWQHKQLQAI